mmetsp:Transcript_31929/g.61449  ORF Transcript_31929/g.61449 Transcript_31929/m.61449 type:complete len:206 (+) Transcript_31929:460-1077(+)
MKEDLRGPKRPGVAMEREPISCDPPCWLSSAAMFTEGSASMRGKSGLRRSIRSLKSSVLTALAHLRKSAFRDFEITTTDPACSIACKRRRSLLRCSCSAFGKLNSESRLADTTLRPVVSTTLGALSSNILLAEMATRLRPPNVGSDGSEATTGSTMRVFALDCDLVVRCGSEPTGARNFPRWACSRLPRGGPSMMFAAAAPNCGI